MTKDGVDGNRELIKTTEYNLTHCLGDEPFFLRLVNKREQNTDFLIQRIKNVQKILKFMRHVLIMCHL